MARMIRPELIASHSKYLAAQREDRYFIPECRRLLDAIKDGVISEFSTEIASGELADHWGRVGVECVLMQLPQWLFFGVYYDTYDHRIEFRKNDEPEFAIFFDAYPNCRDTMARLPGMISAIEEVKRRGFELNFPIDACHNMYRICYWRRSMGDCVNLNVCDLSRMLKEMLRVLFESQFYKLARDAED
jgi:hypothetical protein